ncbi:uncharacterized protein [Maniola hyperantus]|uniref:uncharacterized protein n=1 Tax=Aphantopus hyperantus TaxID=2795564 RepID=UPI00213373E0
MHHSSSPNDASTASYCSEEAAPDLSRSSSPNAASATTSEGAPSLSRRSLETSMASEDVPGAPPNTPVLRRARASRESPGNQTYMILAKTPEGHCSRHRVERDAQAQTSQAIVKKAI